MSVETTYLTRLLHRNQFDTRVKVDTPKVDTFFNISRNSRLPKVDTFLNDEKKYFIGVQNNIEMVNV